MKMQISCVDMIYYFYFQMNVNYKLLRISMDKIIIVISKIQWVMVIDFNNNFTISCNISIIACLNDIPHPEKKEDHKIQTDLILEQVSSTRLKEYIDTLSSFHTRHTKSHHIEKAANWLKSEFENICKGSVFFHNYTQSDQNQTFHLKNIICSKQGLASSSQSNYNNNNNNTIVIGAHYDSRAKN